MNRLPQNDLFPSARPVRSDYARESTISYARRRQITVLVLVALLGLGAYALWGGESPAPNEVPVIAGEGEYKQKPADPGGIDIPHQDVRVYDQLEGKNGVKPAVEHLLPPPEAPKEVPQSAPTEAPSPTAAPVAGVSPKTDLDPAVALKPVETTVNAAPVAPASAPAAAPVAEAPVPAPVAPSPSAASTPVAAPAPAVAPAPVAPKAAAAPKAPALTIEQIIANTKSSSSAKAASVASAASDGEYAVQLASIASEAQAKQTLETLQKKYASELGGAKLHVVRADLGSQGVYYRIRSDGLAKDEANRICSSLKRVNAGCILVGK